jgi:hypothetical protein
LFYKKQKSPTNTQISSGNVGSTEAVAVTRDRNLSQFLMFLSPEDKVVDIHTSLETVERNFLDRQIVLYKDRKGPRVPHHLMARSVSPVAKDVENRMKKFISSH